MKIRRSLRTLALVLAAALLLSVTPLAAGSSTANADRLHALGLFRGTASGYALEQAPTRMQGLIMLIRLLGEEEAALACEDPCPFTDVAGNSAKYAAYAYKQGYTKGTTATTFTPASTLSCKSYVTFLLRALGYDDKNGDFKVSTALSKAGEIGLVEAASAARLSAAELPFYRADLVDLSVAALTTPLKGESRTLAAKLVSAGVFTRSDGQAQGVMGRQLPYTYQDRDYSTVTRVTNTYTVPSGKVTADVITVNTANPGVHVKTATVGGVLGSTAKFSDIVAGTKAAVVIDGNFFEAYKDHKFPIGHVMVDGNFLYGVSGLTGFGFTDSGEVRVGRPAVFFYVEGGRYSWACYECNARSQSSDVSVLYTPAYGPSFTANCDGVVTVISGGVIQSSRAAAAGETVSIPAGSQVMFFGNAFASTDYYRAPVAGTAVSVNPRLRVADPNGFTLEGVTSIVSGAPRLVENGAICTALEPGFQESRFSPTTSSSRTAIGKLANGKLIIVSTGAATIPQMRELMLQLGCVDAVNLDGGASTALAYQGKIVRSPGRELTSTLQIFVD